MQLGQYVLVTPARNEEEYLEATVLSIIGQSLRPARWIIVSDGSTDATETIVHRYSLRHGFIELLALAPRRRRSFSSKARAVQAGYKLLKGSQFGFFGNLDADIVLPPEYYEVIVAEMLQSSNLGIAGGIVWDWVHGERRLQNISLDSVAGAVQLFRRECYEDIGGYQPMRYGGIDAAAEIQAKMRGWGVRTFSALSVVQRRRTGSAGSGVIRASYRRGQAFRTLGYHFLFQTARFIMRLRDSPPVIGATAELAGYLLEWARRTPFGVSEDTVRFLRRTQMRKLSYTIRVGVSNVRRRGLG